MREQCVYTMESLSDGNCVWMLWFALKKSSSMVAAWYVLRQALYSISYLDGLGTLFCCTRVAHVSLYTHPKAISWPWLLDKRTATYWVINQSITWLMPTFDNSCRCANLGKAWSRSRHHGVQLHVTLCLRGDNRSLIFKEPIGAQAYPFSCVCWKINW